MGCCYSNPNEGASASPLKSNICKGSPPTPAASICSENAAEAWLGEIGLPQYAQAFIATGFDDWIQLAQLGEDDLQSIAEHGMITILPGHRKKLLLASRQLQISEAYYKADSMLANSQRPIMGQKENNKSCTLIPDSSYQEAFDAQGTDNPAPTFDLTLNSTTSYLLLQPPGEVHGASPAGEIEHADLQCGFSAALKSSPLCREKTTLNPSSMEDHLSNYRVTCHTSDAQKSSLLSQTAYEADERTRRPSTPPRLEHPSDKSPLPSTSNGQARPSSACKRWEGRRVEGEPQPISASSERMICQESYKQTEHHEDNQDACLAPPGAVQSLRPASAPVNKSKSSAARPHKFQARPVDTASKAWNQDHALCIQGRPYQTQVHEHHSPTLPRSLSPVKGCEANKGLLDPKDLSSWIPPSQSKRLQEMVRHPSPPPLPLRPSRSERFTGLTPDHTARHRLGVNAMEQLPPDRIMPDFHSGSHKPNASPTFMVESNPITMNPGCNILRAECSTGCSEANQQAVSLENRTNSKERCFGQEQVSCPSASKTHYKRASTYAVDPTTLGKSSQLSNAQPASCMQTKSDSLSTWLKQPALDSHDNHSLQLDSHDNHSLHLCKHDTSILRQSNGEHAVAGSGGSCVNVTVQDDTTAVKEMLAQVRAIIKSISKDRVLSHQSGSGIAGDHHSDLNLSLNVPQMDQPSASEAAAAACSKPDLSAIQALDLKQRELEVLHTELMMKLGELQRVALPTGKPGEGAPSIKHEPRMNMTPLQSPQDCSAISSNQIFGSRGTLKEVELRIQEKLRELEAFSESIKDMRALEDAQIEAKRCCKSGGNNDEMCEHQLRKRGLAISVEECSVSGMHPDLSTSPKQGVQNILAACKKRNAKSAISAGRKLHRDESVSVQRQLDEVEKIVGSKINRLKSQMT